MAPQLCTSPVASLLNPEKVTRKARSKRPYLDGAPTRTTKDQQTAKRARTGNESGGRSLIIWRISRAHADKDHRRSADPSIHFSFFRQSTPAAETKATRTTAAGSRSPISTRNSSAIVEDCKDGRANNKKQPADEWGLPMPRLLQMGVIDCNNGGLVRPLRKKITNSDVDRGQNRLLLPKDTLDRPTFERMLTPAELAQAAEKNGLAVKVLDRMLVREYDLVLKFVGSIRAYRIMGRNYNKLVTENNFCAGRFLDLWLFRVPTTNSASSELKMAVVVEDDGRADNEDEKAEANDELTSGGDEMKAEAILIDDDGRMDGEDEIKAAAEEEMEPAVHAQGGDEGDDEKKSPSLEDGHHDEDEKSEAEEEIEQVGGAEGDQMMPMEPDPAEEEAVDGLLLLQYAPPLC